LSQAGVSSEKVLLDGEAIQRSLTRIAHEIVEGNPDLEQVALVGIHTRGVPLAHRLRRLIAELTGRELPIGSVDITFYRDDVQVRGGEAPLHAQPVVRATSLDFRLEGMTLVLVDDVLYTGRTVRAALNEIMDFGRPRRILLAVLVDRGHREIPIRADFVGKNVPTSQSEQIKVRVEKLDGTWEVELVDRGASKG